MTTYFNDMLGTSLAAVGNGNAETFSLTAFGDTIPGNAKSGESARSPLPVPQLDRQSICGGGSPFYTGKPNVPGLGHAFLFRNYRASLGKWQTSDPIGYPDGWNQLAYCGNGAASAVDLWGGLIVTCKSGSVAEVRYVEDIYIYSQEQGSNEGGLFAANVREINGIGGEVTIIIELCIYMSPSMRHSDEFSHGDMTDYAPHVGKHDNCMGRNSVYEAILEHEKAHAASFLSNQLRIFKDLLKKANIDDGSRGFDEMEQLVANAFNEAFDRGALDSNNAANAATLAWFARHKEWKKIYDAGVSEMKRWIKE